MYKCVARWIENWDSVKKSSIIAELLIQDKCLVSYYCILYLIQGVLIIQKIYGESPSQDTVQGPNL